MTTWKAGMLITAARLGDTAPTITTSGLTVATNFTLNSFFGYRVGNTIFLDIYLQYTGAGITATTGNITDTTCCTAPSSWRPTLGTIAGNWDSGTEQGGFVIGTDGICTLRTASDTINTNANLRLHIGFIVD